MSQANSATSEFMTIGSLSRQSRLSLKALRLYHELGLLRPAEVDDSTGYRYYRLDQVRLARLIGLLRQLGMPLDRIREVLEAPEAQRAEEIRSYWREVEGSMAVRLRLVSYLESYLEGRGDEMYEVHTRQVPEQKVLTVKRNVRQPELVGFLMEWMPGVAAALDATGVKHATHTFVVYYGEVNQDSDGPVEVCMAFEGEIVAPEGTQVRIEPAHTEAYATISKRQIEFPRILEAYDAVHDYAETHDLEVTAPPREVYFVDINAVGLDDPFVDIAWPVAPTRALVATQTV
jgi:DNA-binding transcriptional MerR regulator